MREAVSTVVQSTNFGLKKELVELIPAAAPAGRVSMSLRSLEAMRTERATVPASKHGLEAICGASCETGAQ
jgi:Flp pilus assembly protein CpaB